MSLNNHVASLPCVSMTFNVADMLRAPGHPRALYLKHFLWPTVQIHDISWAHVLRLLINHAMVRCNGDAMVRCNEEP